MSCPHAATTTVAFLYGDAPDDHALHVAGCAECDAVVLEHEQVATALVSTLPALRSPSPGVRRQRFPTVVAAGVVMAMAAAALLVVRVGSPPVEDVPEETPDGFDVAIEELDLELTSLELELL